MIFQEVGPNENLDVSRFSSAPFGLVGSRILKMGWGKARSGQGVSRRRPRTKHRRDVHEPLLGCRLDSEESPLHLAESGPVVLSSMKGIPAGRAFGTRIGKKAPCASFATLGFEADPGAQPWRKEQLPCVHDPISVASIRTENIVVVHRSPGEVRPQSDFSFPGFADFLQATNVRTTPEPEASADVD